MPQGWWPELFAVGKTSLYKLISDGDGGQLQIGTAQSVLKQLVSNGFGWIEPEGAAASTLSQLLSDGLGSHSQFGSGASNLAKIISNGEGIGNLVYGPAESALLKLISDGVGTQLQIGTAASTLAKLLSNAAGIQADIGLASSSLPKLSSSGAGQQRVIPIYSSSGVGGTSSWNHGLTAGETVFIVGIVAAGSGINYFGQPAIPPAPATSCTVGGTAATIVGSPVLVSHYYYFNGGNQWTTTGYYAVCYKFYVTASGTKSIVLNPSGSIGDSLSYLNVGSVGTPIVGPTDGSSAVINPSDASTIYLASFFSYDGTFTGFNGTQRYNANKLLVGDIPGNGGSLTVGATPPTTNAGSVIIPVSV